MATQTGPDLNNARAAVERLMDDTCTITIDAQGAGDDVLNDADGSLTPPDPDASTIYDDTTTGDGGRALGARCKVSPAGLAPQTIIEGDVDISQRVYNGSIPWDAPMPPVGGVLKVTSSRRDPQLVNEEFQIRSVVVSTFLVARKMQLVLR